MTPEGAKPCPWCQGHRLWVWEKGPGKPAVACSNPSCGATGPIGKTVQQAVDYWNIAPRNARGLVPQTLRPSRQIDRLLAEMHPPGAEFEA